jgi:hypothetical protein
VPIYLEWVGTIDGNINAQIRARVNGYLQERKYTEGSVVKAGISCSGSTRAPTRPRSTRRAASSAAPAPRSRRRSRT